MATLLFFLINQYFGSSF